MLAATTSTADQGAAGAALPWTEKAAFAASLWAVHALLLLSWLVYRGTYVENAILLPHPDHLNPYLFLLSPYYDASGQKLAYLYFVVGVAGLVLAAPHLGALAATWRRPGVQRWTYRGLLAVWGLMLAWTHPTQPRAPWCVAAGAGIMLVTGLLARWLLRRRWQLVYTLAGLILVVVLTIPGFFRVPDLSRMSSEDINVRDQHLSMVAGPVERLAAGARSTVPHYGLLMPVLLAAWQLWLGPLDLGGYIASFQAFNLVYLLLACYLFTRYCRGRGMLGLAALLLVAPLYHFCHDCLLVPNQAAWRTLGFPLCLLAVFVVRNRPLPAAAGILGVAAGLALLMNFESGVAALVGLLTFLWFRFYSAQRGHFLGRGGSALVCFALGLTAAGAGFLLAVRGLLGYWPDSSAALRLRDNTTFLFTALSGGRPYLGYLFPVVMAVHAGVVLIETALVAKGRVAFRRSFRACVATTLLVWLLYYANRPHFWNLSSYYLLYGFLFIDLLRSVLVPLARHPAGSLRSLRQLGGLAVLALVVLPALVWVVHLESVNLLEGVRVPDHDRERILVSGVYFPRRLGEQLRDQAAYIRQVSTARPATYLTMYSFLVGNLSRVYSPLPGSGSLFDYADQARYRDLVTAMLDSSAEAIYFDAPRADLPPYAGFYWQVRQDLVPHFNVGATSHGWEAWGRRAGQRGTSVP